MAQIVVAIVGLAGLVFTTLAGVGYFRRRGTASTVTAAAAARVAEPGADVSDFLLQRDAAEADELRAEVRALNRQLASAEVRAGVLDERLKSVRARAEKAERDLAAALIARDEALAEHRRLTTELAECRRQIETMR